MVPKNDPDKGRPGDTTDLNLAITFRSHRLVLMMLSNSPQMIMKVTVQCTFRPVAANF